MGECKKIATAVQFHALTQTLADKFRPKYSVSYIDAI